MRLRRCAHRTKPVKTITGNQAEVAAHMSTDFELFAFRPPRVSLSHQNRGVNRYELKLLTSKNGRHPRIDLGSDS
jgi:hypothetical protein